MPFGPLRSPSLGLSLLQASIPRLRCSILYCTLPFAEAIGVDFYQEIAHGGPRGTCLLGEWIFASALFGQRPAADEEYLDRLLRPEVEDGLYPELLSRVLEARAVVDAFLDGCVEAIEQRRPRVVGFTSVFEQQMASLAAASRLEARRPEIAIVFGGANCEGPMGRGLIRAFPFVDAAVSGEAEALFPILVDRLLSGEPVDDLPGVLVQKGGGAKDDAPAPTPRPAASLDDLPYPDFDDFFAQWAGSEASRELAPRLLFETSRGCWWGEKQHCTFCGLNGSSMAFRSKSPERALAELGHMARKHPGHSIMVVDNILDMAYFETLLPELARRKLGLRLFYEVKANLRKDQVRALRDAGVGEIQPGIESLSDTVLAVMRKGVSALQNIQLLKWCAELRIWPSWHFIWGFPGEPEDEYRRMAELVPLLAHLPPPNVAMAIRLDRFSPNFQEPEKLGLVDVEPVPAYAYVYDLGPESLADIAYYFTFGYRDGRDVAAYTRPLADAVNRWQQAYPEAELLFDDRGEELWIWDLRPGAERSLTVLSGIEKKLYRACDGIRTFTSLASSLDLAVETVDDLLDPLVAAGLMVREGRRVLSLAMEQAGQRGLLRGRIDGRRTILPRRSQGEGHPSR